MKLAFALPKDGIEGLKDIDFDEHKNFSDYYLLRGSNEKEIRNLFNAQLIYYFENNKDSR